MTDLAPIATEAKAVLDRCAKDGLRIATAESCTGGLIAAALTEHPGSAAAFDRGFVTYSNEAKTQMIGVPAELIQKHGAVSIEVAIAMAEGALNTAGVDLAVGVTGIAGPDGGTATKPVGLVCFAAARRGGPTRSVAHIFENFGRDSIRQSAAIQGLRMLLQVAAGG